MQKSLTWHIILFKSLLVMPVFSSSLFAQQEIERTLKPGKFQTGFFSTVDLITARDYPYCLDSSLKIKKYPKPLIINVWYPPLKNP